MPRKILIVDDNAINRQMLANALCEEYDTLEAADGKEALEVIRRQDEMLSAVLLDIVMPEMDGYDVLRAVRSDGARAQIPIIMVTGSEDEDSRVKALSLGANDFIQKPFNPEIVKHCLKNNIALRETASILNAIQKDKLTGLYSRTAFFDRVSAAIAEREPGFYLLSCFDIDNFKLINDQYGAAEGDRILREIGRVVAEDMAQVDGIGGRISADNFAVLLPMQYKEMSITRIVRQNRMAFSDKQATVFSVGRYIVSDVTLQASAIYDRAYIAKQSVKGRYDEHIAYFDETMLEKLVRDQQIIADMDAAIAHRQFEVWFQPQRNHATGALIGAEALVRWRHPEKGLIPPGDFIPVFEQNGFVYELDKYVWEETCRYLRKWIDEGRNPLPVSVNLSRYDVFRPDVISTLTGYIEAYRIPVALLRLEITESAFSKSTQTIVSIVKQLIDKGFTIEIDDFGSGYSSLNTLKSVPAQVLKLDMRFLQDDGNSGRGGNILESVVRMAKWLGMSVIAEGVEEKAQADYLVSIGCSYIQGYLYARPMPAPDYEAYCRNIGKEERLLTMETVANLDKNAFWDPKSMDTLIFNSYVGAACIFEYYNGYIELLRANTKFAAILGDGAMSVEETLRLDWIACLAPESRELVRNVLRWSGDTGDEYIREYVFQNIPGSAARTHLRATMRVIATAGERRLVYCTCENVTAQRQAEENERRAEQKELAAVERLQLILSNIESAVQVTAFEEDGARLVFANDQYYAQLGYTKAFFEREKPDLFSFIHPEDRGRAIQMATEANAERRPYALTYRLIRRDGSVFWRQSRVSFVDFPGEARPVQLSVANDITAMKEAERKTVALADRLQAVMDNVDCGITAITYDADDVEYLMINDRYFEMLGYTKAQYAKLETFSPVYEDDRRQVMEASRRAYEGDQPMTIEFRAVKRDGSIIWMRDAMTMTRFSGVDKPVQLSMFFDITAERQAAGELLDNLPCGAALYDYDGRELRAVHLNKRYWTLVDRAPMDVAALSVAHAVHPGDRETIIKEIESALREGRDLSCDIRIRYGKEGYRPFHVTGRAVRKTEGRYAIYASYTPISDAAMSIQETLPIALRAVMSSSAELAFVKGKDLRYLNCSRSFANLAGRSDERELIGRTASDVFPAALAAQYGATDRTVMESGRSLVDFESEFPTARGIKHLLFSKYPLLDAGGNVVGIYGTGRDVTEAREAKSRLELLTNNVPGGIAIYEGTPDALDRIRLTYFSDGFCRLFGYTRAEYEKLATENPLGLVFPADISTMYRKILALVRNGVPMDYIYRARTGDGVARWINVKAVMGEPNGENLTVNAVFFDVTEQKEALEKLRVSEEVNRLAIQQSKNVVCRYDVAARRLFMSPSVNPIFEVSDVEEDVPDRPVREGKVSPDTAAAYVAFYESIRRGEKHGEVLFQRKAAFGWRWVEAKFTTIFTDGGEPATAVVSLTDATERIEKDTAYKRWRQSLSSRSPDSYSLFRCDIGKESSFDTREGSLLSVSFSPGGFAFDSHTRQYASQFVFPEDAAEFSAFLKRDALLANYYQGNRVITLEYREKLPRGGFRWLRLTAELVQPMHSSEIEAYLLFEDIDEAKRAELEIVERAETDPLTGLLNRATFAQKVDRRIAESKPDARHALLMMDIDGFKQVNDVFGHSAGDQTLIDVAEILRGSSRRGDLVGRLGGDEFVVFLADIPEDAVAANKAMKLCELTHKSLRADVQISGSVGIALYPKDGARFEALYKKADDTLYYVKGTGKNNYAFYHDEMAADAESPSAGRSGGGASVGGVKRRMLIVDDNRIDYEMLANMFAGDFRIEKARDGASALIKLQHYRAAISVVLLDLIMPGVDGFEVLEKMRRSAEMRAIPVVVVSGAGDREASLKAIRAGATDYVTKPVDPDILRIRVQSAISRAENERLRVQNSFLELRSAETDSLRMVLERTGTLVIALDWGTGAFTYDASLSKRLAGRYDARSLWYILMADLVAEPQTVRLMQQLVHDVANDRQRTDGRMTALLKSAAGGKRLYEVNVYKRVNEYGLADKLIITLQEKESE